ncbi:MAG: hypothetical protein V6Z89_06285 [Desulfobacter sp.]
MKAFPRYLDRIARVNGLTLPEGAAGNGPEPAGPEWIFYPGMLQDSLDKWWADFGFRHACHEGIDICFYRTGNRISALAPGAKVPAMFGGTLVNVADDLLGKSMVVSYAPDGGEREAFVMVYAHLDVDPAMVPGAEIRPGQVIARTFDTRIKKSKLLSHLHLSCIRVPRGLPPGQMNWSLFPDREKVVYINPVFL